VIYFFLQYFEDSTPGQIPAVGDGAMFRTALCLSFVCLLGWSPARAFQNGAVVGPLEGPISVRPDVRAASVIDTESHEAHLRVDASLVLIPVQISTPMGEPVTDLAKENFRVFEDGVEQKISHFAKDDAPISIGIVFDSSGSMQNKMRKSLEAASTFFKTANPGDEFFLVDFNERPKLAVGFTTDSGELYRRISHTRPFGRTSLFDAIDLAVRQMKKAKNERKAIVIVSDGGDNRSRLTYHAVKNLMLEAGVLLYSMGIFDPSDSPKLPREEREGPGLLDDLTEITGGRNYRVDNLDDLPGISARIGLQLRNQYVIGYTPANDGRDGKYRRVKLAVVHPEGVETGNEALRVQYRTGYYAPAQ
jgi:VWFA-related protein